jgi:hypothetical protein
VFLNLPFRQILNGVFGLQSIYTEQRHLGKAFFNEATGGSVFIAENHFTDASYVVNGKWKLTQSEYLDGKFGSSSLDVKQHIAKKTVAS